MPTGEWNGAWSDSDRRWTAEAKRALGHSDADNGEFWMTVTDCLANFTNFYWGELFPDSWARVRVANQWKGRTAGGCVNHDTWRCNPQMPLQVTTPIKAQIVLTQV